MTANPPHKAFSSKGNRYKLFCFSMLYWINELIVRSNKIEQLLWDCIKVELFYIGGHCKNSGNCCRGIMLFHENQPVLEKELFKTLLKQKPATYDRFLPIQETGNLINYYDCNKLTPNNMCSDYKNRPSFCQRYPLSSFLKNDSLMTDCGYKLLPTLKAFKFKHPKLQSRIESISSTGY